MKSYIVHNNAQELYCNAPVQKSNQFDRIIIPVPQEIRLPADSVQDYVETSFSSSSDLLHHAKELALQNPESVVSRAGLFGSLRTQSYVDEG